MAYLVLARKYRPQTFTEVVGQEHVTRTLANAFAQDRVHHAFLFCGPRGCGKTTTARILGKALNCETGPTAQPCGSCQACRSISEGSSVDYFEMDGASNRGIDAIRELTDAVRYQPAVLRKKVYVIDEVHMLTTEAFNALLKTLEEPPPHVTFVLATTEPHKVPNTILSRCQRYDFKLVPSPRLAEHVAAIFGRESIDSEPGAVQLVVRESGGSVRDALSLCDQIISYVGNRAIAEGEVAEILGVADRALTRTLVQALASGNAQQALEAVESATARGVDEVQVARAIVRYLRDLAVTQVAPSSDALVDAPVEERAELGEMAVQIARARVKQMFERMLRACEDLAQTQQPRLVLDLALIDVATQEALVPLGDLLERLGDLERRLAGGGSGGGPGRAPSGSGPGGGRGPASGRAQGGPARASGPAAASAPAPSRQGSSPPAAVAPSSAAAAPPPSPQPPFSRGSSGDGRLGAAPSASEASAVLAGVSGGGRPDAPLSASEASAMLAGVSASLSGRGPGPAANVPVELARPSAGAALAGPDVARPADSPPTRRPPRDEEPPPPWETQRADGPAPGGSPVVEAAAPPALETFTVPAQGPAPGASESPRDLLRAWEGVITALEEARQISLITVYQTAKILSWDARGIVVGFSSSSLTSEIATSKEKVAAMQAFLAEHCGRPVGFEVKALTAEEESRAKSLLEDAAQKADEERSARRREAEEHPLTKVVLDTFGATIKEIKTHV